MHYIYTFYQFLILVFEPLTLAWHLALPVELQELYDVHIFCRLHSYINMTLRGGLNQHVFVWLFKPHIYILLFPKCNCPHCHSCDESIQESPFSKQTSVVFIFLVPVFNFHLPHQVHQHFELHIITSRSEQSIEVQSVL